MTTLVALLLNQRTFAGLLAKQDYYFWGTTFILDPAEIYTLIFGRDFETFRTIVVSPLSPFFSFGEKKPCYFAEAFSPTKNHPYKKCNVSFFSVPLFSVLTKCCSFVAKDGACMKFFFFGKKKILLVTNNPFIFMGSGFPSFLKEKNGIVFFIISSYKSKIS